MLAAVVQSATSAPEPPRLERIAPLAVLMSVGWLLQFILRWAAQGVWLLGVASCALMYVMPGTAPVIGIAGALIIAGQRMPLRSGATAAIVLSIGFLLADGFASHWTNLLALGFAATGLAFAYMAASSVRQVREQRERAETLLAELQRTRASEIERAALAERARIAREIHDVLAHTLSALAVQLEGTRMLVEQRPGDPLAVAAVERAHRLASEGLAEARRAIGALRGDSLPGPEGLQQLLDEFTEATGTPGHFEVRGDPIPLASEARLALYRTAQEALTNVRKHAREATSVDLCLRYAPDGAELVVEDVVPKASSNGTGPAGYGLVGMRERAELVGGTLEAGPLPTGFRVRLWLPTS